MAAPDAAGLDGPSCRGALLPKIPDVLGGQGLRDVRMHSCLLGTGHGVFARHS